MIDLEDALSALVDRAPAPPGVASVARRARQRRRRRRALAFVTAVAILGVGIGGALAVGSSRSAPHVSGPVPAVEHVRLTMLDGSQIEIRGPASLGLTKLAPAFNGELDIPGYKGTGPPPFHSFSVERAAPDERGAVVGRYPTADGHELVVYATRAGSDAVVRYPGWALVVTWNHDPTSWAGFASALNAKETADGFLVIEPVGTWRFGPTDAPDAQLGGTGQGGDATFSFSRSAFPRDCPEQSSTHTSQGWPVLIGDGASWCDPNAKMRVTVEPRQLVDQAVHGLSVSYSDSDHSIDRVTALNGATFEISAPASALDQLTLESDVYIDGLDHPNLLNETPNLLPISATRAALPARAATPTYATADGHRLYSYVPPTDCGCQELTGTYGDWLVEIEVQGMSRAQRTQIASLFAASESAAGFLVVRPVAPMHGGSGGPLADMVFDGFDMYTSQYNACSPPNRVDTHTPQGYGVHIAGGDALWCDPVARVHIDILDTAQLALVNELRVRRVDP